MTTEEIRQKAIKCGWDFETMCVSNAVYDSKFKIKCADSCQYKGLKFCEAAYGYEHGFVDGVEEGKKLAAKWIPVTERLPENEETVLITVEDRPIFREPYRRVIKAFHEDGNMNTEDSNYGFDTSDSDWEYDEESGGCIIPEGWYEDTDYCGVFGTVDSLVLAWMPLPKPFEGEA